MSVKDIIDGVVEENPVAVRNALADVMLDKVRSAILDRKAEVAQSFFQAAHPEYSDEDDEEDVEVDDEDLEDDVEDEDFEEDSEDEEFEDEEFEDEDEETEVDDGTGDQGE